MTEENKIKEWEGIQHELFSRADLPKSEYYSLSWGIGSSESLEDNEVQRSKKESIECREVDDRFSHYHFQLPVKILSAFVEAYRWIDPCFSAQLQHDLDQQYLFHSKNEGEIPRKKSVEKEEEEKRKDHNQAPSSSPLLPPLTHVGGMDISFLPHDPNRGVVCLVILCYPSLELVKVFLEECILTEEYIPGFLAFREAPPLCRLWENFLPAMQQEGCVPQLIVVDGCGTHHVRRAGLALHLGVLLNIPTIGCAKNMLMVGEVGAEEVVQAVTKKKAWCARYEKQGKKEESVEKQKPIVSVLSQCQLAAPYIFPSPAFSSSLGTSFSPMKEHRKECAPKKTCACAVSIWHFSSEGQEEGSSSIPVIYPIVSHLFPPILYGYAAMSSASPKKCIYISPGNHIGYAMSVALVLSMCCHRIPQPTRLADFYSRERIRHVMEKRPS